MRNPNLRAMLIAFVLLLLFAAAGQAAFGISQSDYCMRIFCSAIYPSYYPPSCPVPDLGELTRAEFCEAYWQNRVLKGR